MGVARSRTGLSRPLVDGIHAWVWWSGFGWFAEGSRIDDTITPGILADWSPSEASPPDRSGARAAGSHRQHDADHEHRRPDERDRRWHLGEDQEREQARADGLEQRRGGDPRRIEVAHRVVDPGVADELWNEREQDDPGEGGRRVRDVRKARKPRHRQQDERRDRVRDPSVGVDRQSAALGDAAQQEVSGDGDGADEGQRVAQQRRGCLIARRRAEGVAETAREMAIASTFRMYFMAAS